MESGRSYSMTVSCQKCNLLLDICRLTGYDQCLYFDGGPLKNLEIQCAITALSCVGLPVKNTIYECSDCPDTCCSNINDDMKTQICIEKE